MMTCELSTKALDSIERLKKIVIKLNIHHAFDYKICYARMYRPDFRNTFLVIEWVLKNVLRSANLLASEGMCIAHSELATTQFKLPHKLAPGYELDEQQLW